MAFVILHHFGAETDICLKETSKKLLSISTEEPHRLFIVGKHLGGGLPPGCVIQVGGFWQNGLLALKMVAGRLKYQDLVILWSLLMATRNPANAPVEVGS